MLSKVDIKKGLKIPAKVSPELAYLIGILMGDGSISYRKNKNEYSIICGGNPKDEKELYHQVIGPLFYKVFGVSLRFKSYITVYGFRVYSKSLFNYLTTELGLWSGKKDSSLHIPEIFTKDENLILPLLRGLFDTDGCISFKKKYKTVPYYPVISLCSQSKRLIQQVATMLKELGFSVAEIYDYTYKDKKISSGYTTINRLDINGRENFNKWLKIIGFSSPKHLNKIGRKSLENFPKL